MQAAVVQGLGTRARVLVAGASSGIGFAMVARLLADDAVAGVHAVARSAASSPALQALAAAHAGRLHLVGADLACEAGHRTLAEALAPLDALHLAVNCIGMLHAEDIAPEKSLEQVSLAGLSRVFNANAFVPILLARTLLPHLLRTRPTLYASLSARVGSIADNRRGGWYAYRASKAAQNQLLRTLALELRRRNPRATVLLLHPGTVATPLSAPFQAGVAPGGLFAPEQAAAHLLGLVARATPEDSGRFLAWDGADIPW